MARAKKQNPEKNSGKMAVQKAVRDSALAKVQNIIEDTKAAEYFFYVEMAPKMSAIAAGYNSSFNVDIIAKDVSTATYLSCWEDDWAKLKAFHGETTLHTWVAKIASQATYQMLVEERFIDGVGKTKTNDYRLTIRSIEDEFIRKEIVGMVYVPEMHKALELYYVDKDWDSNVSTFVKSFINGLGWDEREIDVWTERFFNNTPSLELAEKHHVRNTWIDNTYSRLNKRFRIAIK